MSDKNMKDLHVQVSHTTLKELKKMAIDDDTPTYLFVGNLLDSMIEKKLKKNINSSDST